VSIGAGFGVIWILFFAIPSVLLLVVMPVIYLNHHFVLF